MEIKNLALFYLLIISICSCSPKNYSNRTEYQFKSKSAIPDYSNLKCWAAHPWKWDPSDSVPKPLRIATEKDTAVDVFFVHPTSFTDYQDSLWNARIDDSALNSKTDYSSILYQASVFNEQSRIFAPRYRQAHLRAFYSPDKVKAGVAFELAYSDIKAAFEYFLEHLNKGRPVIIAAHSQGTLHAGRLLKEYFEGKALQSSLVCAYLIGLPVTESYFEKIKPCTDSLSTGCFVSWRTYKKNYIDTNFISKETFRCYVTNPLTWKLTEEYAPRSTNYGSVLKNFNKLKKNVVDAQVHQNILWTCKPRFFGNIFLTQKNYHIADINFFYNNIRENLKTRIKVYFKK